MNEVSCTTRPDTSRTSAIVDSLRVAAGWLEEARAGRFWFGPLGLFTRRAFRESQRNALEIGSVLGSSDGRPVQLRTRV